MDWGGLGANAMDWGGQRFFSADGLTEKIVGTSAAHCIGPGKRGGVSHGSLEKI